LKKRKRDLPDEANIPDLAAPLAVEIGIPKEDDSLLSLGQRVYAALTAHQFAHLRVHRWEFIFTYGRKENSLVKVYIHQF